MTLGVCTVLNEAIIAAMCLFSNTVDYQAKVTM